MSTIKIENLENKLFSRSFQVINKKNTKRNFNSESFMKSAEAIEKANRSRDAKRENEIQTYCCYQYSEEKYLQRLKKLEKTM